jgi:hypothetical protein
MGDKERSLIEGRERERERLESVVFCVLGFLFNINI